MEGGAKGQARQGIIITLRWAPCAVNVWASSPLRAAAPFFFCFPSPRPVSPSNRTRFFLYWEGRLAILLCYTRMVITDFDFDFDFDLIDFVFPCDA